MPQLFPASITEFSVESLIKKHSTRSKIIYWLLITLLAFFFIILFTVKTDVSVNSRGMVTSKEYSTRMLAAVYGKVSRFSIVENVLVQKGDTLLSIDTLEIAANIRVIKHKLHDITRQNKDLTYLTKLEKKSVSGTNHLTTTLYKQELEKFLSDLRYQKSQIDLLQKEFNRQKKLFQKQVIPQAEYENIFYKLENEQLRYHQIFNNQLANWQARFYNNTVQILNLQERQNNLQKELKKYFMVSPITGYVQNINGVKEGGWVYPNQEICIVSPTTHLIAETYVSTADIGLIQPQQSVKIRVDAFNYNEWGMLTGKVYEIGKDINLVNGVPMFRVRCKLDGTALEYENKKVNVVKGMTVTANFFLIKRTLAQLLYDNITDWLDPKQKEVATKNN